MKLYRICNNVFENDMKFCPECGAKNIIYDENVYTADGCPISIIHKDLILTDSEISISIIFRNITNKEINTCLINLKCFDSFGEQLADTSVNYLDLQAEQNEEFGEEQVIIPNDQNTRNFEIEIEKILFSDGTLFKGDQYRFTIDNKIAKYDVTSKMYESLYSKLLNNVQNYYDNKTSYDDSTLRIKLKEENSLLLKNITQFTIPHSVTSIGEFTFYGCDSLTEIIIPSSVTSIGNSAFNYCTSLTEITIPSSVTSIEDHAFSDCTSLTEITIPSSVTSIEDYAFYGCTSLTEITIPSSVTSIEDYAFYGCTSLTEITIPSSVTSIEDHAFSGCTSLTEITIPNSVTSIEKFAFDCCTSLTEITIPNSVTSIEDDAFFYCTSLQEINIPNSVTSIKEGAFSYCFSLTEITIPSSVTLIEEYAFNNCTNLKKVRILNPKLCMSRDRFVNCNNELIIERGGQFCKMHQLPSSLSSSSSSGCYIATCVYGSYDCPEVWTLRRFRDNKLAASWYGRLFIRAYYAVSPKLVKRFGETKWFKKLWKCKLDKMVERLKKKGYEDNFYRDR